MEPPEEREQMPATKPSVRDDMAEHLRQSRELMKSIRTTCERLVDVGKFNPAKLSLTQATEIIEITDGRGASVLRDSRGALYLSTVKAGTRKWISVQEIEKGTRSKDAQSRQRALEKLRVVDSTLRSCLKKQPAP